jgi:hypothetical protein
MASLRPDTAKNSAFARNEPFTESKRLGEKVA